MKPFKLAALTPPAWVATVEHDPTALLSDHAHCELKAAATAQALLLKHRTNTPLVAELSAMAAEEMEHFRQAVELLHLLGGTLGPVEVNEYAERLLADSGPTRGDSLLDRLLIAGLIELRSLERFHLLAEGLHDERLAALYRALVPSESGHQALFDRLARNLFDARLVAKRQTELLEIEARCAREAAPGPRVHSGWATL
ncbi:MAG: hypothetical protein H6831_16760 [Planctomycetes bacterium]|nr:hypothetical protein [Planctomycetota bacterium]MCB9906054.1 hypothetical protein [Planctomycetota bacterium]